jgi:hypothetical protein
MSELREVTIFNHFYILYKHNSAASEVTLIMVQLFHHKRPMDAAFENKRSNYCKQSQLWNSSVHPDLYLSCTKEGSLNSFPILYANIM